MDENTIFEKLFTFTRSESSWNLPSSAALFTAEKFEIPNLVQMKSELNAVKTKLNDFKIESWAEHTKRRNISGDVLTEVGKRAKVEFLTQAWLKMYECLHAGDLVKTEGQFNSLHLCEAPGAFIAALNHFIALNRSSIAWNWSASTLNPYYEGNDLGRTVMDDRFILHTHEQWDFGVDATGNLMEAKNVARLVERTQARGGADLVTADGSIDCIFAPDQQEERVADLQLAEACTALKALRAGGCLVLKMFTFFEHSSVNLVFLLNCVFERVKVFKPATSKSGNSEVYVIGEGFRPPGGDFLDVLAERSRNGGGKTMFPRELLPEDFIGQLETCAKFFMNFQIDVIETNIHFYGRKSVAENQRLRTIREKVARNFLQRYELRPIPAEKKILYGKQVLKTLFLTPRMHHGSHTERQQQRHLSESEQFAFFEDQLQQSVIGSDLSGEIEVETTEETPPPAGLEDFFHLQTGKPIESLQSSKFVFMPNMALFTEILRFVRDNRKTPISQLFTQTKDKHGAILDIHPSGFLAAKTYDDYEKLVTWKLLEIVQKLEPGESLKLRNLLVLTQFLNGILVFLVRFAFDGLKLFKEGEIHLISLKVEAQRNVSILTERLTFSPIQDNAVIGVTPIQSLILAPLFKSIVCYNSCLCVKYSMEVLRFYSSCG